MFFDTSPTPYDVRFRLFGIPIRIHPSFWLIELLIVYNILSVSLIAGVIVVVVAFFSLLCHELAHSLMFRKYRIYSSIVLYSFGGYSRPDHDPPRYTQRIAVALAGPFANLVILGLTWASNELAPWALAAKPYTLVAYIWLVEFNLVVMMFNLLPIWPLDGGRVSMELWVRARPRNGQVQALRMSIAVAILIVLYSIFTFDGLIPDLPEFFRRYTLGPIGIVLFSMIAFANYQQLQLLSRQRSYYDSDLPPWRR